MSGILRRHCSLCMPDNLNLNSLAAATRRISKLLTACCLPLHDNFTISWLVDSSRTLPQREQIHCKYRPGFDDLEMHLIWGIAPIHSDDPLASFGACLICFARFARPVSRSELTVLMFNISSDVSSRWRVAACGATSTFREPWNRVGSCDIIVTSLTKNSHFTLESVHWTQTCRRPLYRRSRWVCSRQSSTRLAVTQRSEPVSQRMKW